MINFGMPHSALKRDAVVNTYINTRGTCDIPYGSLVHELGHDIGIRDGIDDMGQEVHHPNEDLHSAIMSYGGDPPRCSPHPLDIMAIFAIYQTE